MRNAFIEELVSAARNGKNVALVVGDLGYKVIEPFADEFPHLFFNSGIAEQNMMGLAAGMASEGVHVFVYSIANFPTFRCAEQIRNDVDYHGHKVTIVTVGGGLSYGNLGYSHHAIQDYALMRLMPNMLIASPGDSFEARACMRYLIENPRPSYLRLGKSGERELHAGIPHISPGEWLPVIVNMRKSALITTGATLQLANELISKGAIDSHDLYSLPLWGMNEKNIQQKYINQFDQIVTCEDHLLDGGFGSWFLETAAKYNLGANKIQLIGLDSKVCGLVGGQSVLNKDGGLDIESIARVICRQ